MDLEEVFQVLRQVQFVLILNMLSINKIIRPGTDDGDYLKLTYVTSGRRTQDFQRAVITHVRKEHDTETPDELGRRCVTILSALQDDVRGVDAERIWIPVGVGATQELALQSLLMRIHVFTGRSMIHLGHYRPAIWALSYYYSKIVGEFGSLKGSVFFKFPTDKEIIEAPDITDLIKSRYTEAHNFLAPRYKANTFHGRTD